MILYSDNYDMFEFRKENRPLLSGHVDKLARRISEYGYAPDAAIVVSATKNGKLSIVDGQHRFSACKNLKMKVPYVLIDESQATSKIIERNTYSRTWTMNDFARFYAELGNKSYQKFIDFRARYGLQFRDAFALLSQPGKKMQRDLHHDFKDGLFYTNEELESLAIQKMDLVNDILKYNDYTRSVGNCGALVLSVLKLISHPDYQHHRMMSRLEELSTRFVKCSTRGEYQEMLASIYNYKRRVGRLILSRVEKGAADAEIGDN